MDDLAQLRKSYELAELDEAASKADPMLQFELWFAQALAAQLPEPNAMTLATVGVDGRPSTRVVLVKALDARGLVWYTNYASRKGHELDENRFAALQFHWVELERVVRIEGAVAKVSAEQSEAYFATRPHDSRVAACASPQSEVIASRDVLVERVAKVNAGLAGGVTAEPAIGPPRPPYWGGYRLVPDRWEFWQGRRSRLHDRLQYRRHGPEWIRERLAP